ncbi:MAG: alpha-1,4-glucan--maltose-1-phosphate maltosyltransferase [Opitutales bacterium]|nr:alpha-1,4-glucan--maltose-1-phosphate maltosyltransferase [Opitutales bacterium]
MNSLRAYAGRRRVLVDLLIPSIPRPRAVLKRPLGEPIHWRAHVFADGHDLVRAFFRFRKAGTEAWTQVAMHAEPNDEYTLEWNPAEIGLYEIAVSGVIDHFGSWRAGFIKKVNAGEQVDVDLRIGADLIGEAVDRAAGEDAAKLKGWRDFLADNDRDFRQRVEFARSDEVAGLVDRYPAYDLETVIEPVRTLSVERELAICGAWYEYFPRSCADDGHRHGTFDDAAKRLPEIAAMGFDIVYFPPIHPIGVPFRKGKNNSLTPDSDDVGSPWAIGGENGGHKAIHPELGDFESFGRFVEAVKSHGMELALDIAFQCAPDHPYVRENPQWFRWRPDGTVQYAENPPKKYQDILPFDFETTDWENLWAELKSVFDFWIEKGVKIFRVDNPHTKSFIFWEWCIQEIKKVHPEAIFLAEAFTRPKRKYWLGRAGFTQGYTYFTWRNDARVMREYLEELTQTEVADYFWPNFWPNTPDILHEDLQTGNRATFIGRYVLAATLSSNVGIYGPAYEIRDHIPFPGKEEYTNNEKYELKRWNWTAPGNIREEITLVNLARRENPALQRTRNLTFCETDNPYFIAYLKQTPDRTNQILVVVSMDWNWAQMGHITLPLEQMGLGSDREFGVEDLLDSRRTVYRWKGKKNFVRLDPRRSPAHIFRIVL